MTGTRLTFRNGQVVDDVDCDHPDGWCPTGDGLERCPECDCLRIPP